MEDPVARNCGMIGLSDDVARRASRIIPGFRDREYPSDCMVEILSVQREASELTDTGGVRSEKRNTSGGLSGGGRTMAALTADWPVTGPARGVTREITDFAKDKGQRQWRPLRDRVHPGVGTVGIGALAGLY